MTSCNPLKTNNYRFPPSPTERVEGASESPPPLRTDGLRARAKGGMHNGNMRDSMIEPHPCACGCGQTVERRPDEPGRRYRRRRFASAACRYRRNSTQPSRTCENEGCENTFRPTRHDHKYCSSRCRDQAALGMEPVRLDPEKGGIDHDGGLVCGTEWRQPDVDVRNPPQDDPRFW